jgi:hypothetical protein
MWEWTVAPVRGRIAQVCVPVSDALGPTSSSLRTPESVAVLRAVLAPRWEDRLVIQTAASFSVDSLQMPPEPGWKAKEGREAGGGWVEGKEEGQQGQSKQRWKRGRMGEDGQAEGRRDMGRFHSFRLHIWGTIQTLRCPVHDHKPPYSSGLSGVLQRRRTCDRD